MKTYNQIYIDNQPMIRTPYVQINSLQGKNRAYTVFHSNSSYSLSKVKTNALKYYKKFINN